MGNLCKASTVPLPYSCFPPLPRAARVPNVIVRFCAALVCAIVHVATSYEQRPWPCFATGLARTHVFVSQHLLDLLYCTICSRRCTWCTSSGPAWALQWARRTCWMTSLVGWASSSGVEFGLEVQGSGFKKSFYRGDFKPGRRSGQGTPTQ